jgi:hypothetical protein
MERVLKAVPGIYKIVVHPGGGLSVCTDDGKQMQVLPSHLRTFIEISLIGTLQISFDQANVVRIKETLDPVVNREHADRE